LVREERLLQRVAQPLERDAGLRVGGVAPAVAAVDRLVRVQEEAVPRQIVVELEQAQVRAGDAR
jgi:hypothetical protein